MVDLIKQVQDLKKTEVKNLVENRLKEFEVLNSKGNQEWFSELCFCLLTANSKAKTAINIQKELGFDGFSKMSKQQISLAIKNNKHRFHNNKAKFIVASRKHMDIKNKLKNLGEFEAREWLVQNIKGLGYKEASHFLRNTGHKNLAILDRHILDILAENKYIQEKPESLDKKTYLEIEKVFNILANHLEMTSAELDLYLWYIETGEVLK